jgi:glutamate racemase
MVVACNTGSVHALEALRAEFEPGIPVIGTVPAIKPAAASHHSVAIWATVATTGSAYQRRLIAEFGGSAEVTEVACLGLADAVDAGDEAATAAAVAAAVAQTPANCEAVVLGCTEYELAADRICQAVPGAVTFGSAGAVAAQALRRVPRAAQANAERATNGSISTDAIPTGGVPADGIPTDALPADGIPTNAAPAEAVRTAPTVRVLLSGRLAPLPRAALLYPEGRLLAPMVVLTDDHGPMAGAGSSLIP